MNKWRWRGFRWWRPNQKWSEERREWDWRDCGRGSRRPEYRIRREEVRRDVDLIVFRHQGFKGYNLQLAFLILKPSILLAYLIRLSREAIQWRTRQPRASRQSLERLRNNEHFCSLKWKHALDRMVMGYGLYKTQLGPLPHSPTSKKKQPIRFNLADMGQKTAIDHCSDFRNAGQILASTVSSHAQFYLLSSLFKRWCQQEEKVKTLLEVWYFFIPQDTSGTAS